MSGSLTISVAAACRRYGVDRHQVYKLMERGYVPYVKLGRRILIMTPFADAYFARAAAEPVAKETQLSFTL